MNVQKNRTKKQILLNLFWSVFSGTLGYIVNFLLTPIITNNVGIEAYGFITLANTLILYVNIITVGINSFSARYIAVHYHNGEYNTANSYFNSVLAANISIAIAIIIPSVSIIARLEKIINIPRELQFDVKLLFVFVVLSYFVGTLSSILSSGAFIKNKMDITSKINGVSKILYAILIIMSLYSIGVRIYLIGFINLAVSVFVLIANAFYGRKLTKELTLDFSLARIEKIKSLVSVGIYNSITYLGGTLGSGLDLLLTNKMLSNIIMGQISVANQLGTLMYTAVNAVSYAFRPKELEAYSHHNISEVIHLIKISINSCEFVANVCLGVFLFIGRSFLTLWIPGQDVDKIFAITLIVIVGNVFSSSVMPMYYVTTLTARMKTISAITVTCGIVNVLSMIVLLQTNFEGAYIVVGTTAVLNLVPVIAFPILTKKYFGLDKTPFVREVFNDLICIIALMITYKILPIKIVAATWFNLFFYTAITVIIVSIIVGIVVLDKQQINALWNELLNGINKIRNKYRE